MRVSDRYARAKATDVWSFGALSAAAENPVPVSPTLEAFVAPLLVWAADL